MDTTADPATMVQAETAPRHRWLGELPVFVIAAVLLVLCLGLMARKGIYFGPELILANGQIYVVSAVLMLALDAGWRLWKDRPDSPVAHLKAAYSRPDRVARLIGGLPMLLLLASFMPFFSKMKAMIPLFTDYTWDAAFIAWDRALFFGYDGWQVLQPIFGYPVITAFMALLYQLWFLLIYPGCLFFLFYRVNSTLRRRFFLGFILSWTLIGGAMATALASVGPCFLDPLIGDPHFAAQMAYLNAANEQVPVMTLTVQQMLLDWFHADARGLGSGITAMPSMHVAMCFLYYLAIREHSRVAGRFFLGFLILIWIGSVHLAYHYAVDGLVSIVVVAAIWWASKYLFACWDKQVAARTTPLPVGA